MKSLQLAASLAFLTACGAAQAQKPANLDSGIVYETTTRTSMEGMPFGAVVEKTRTIETRRGMRIDILERSATAEMGPQSNPALGTVGSYRIALDGGRRMVVVDTLKREYYEIDYKQLSGMGQDMSKMIASMGLRISGVKFDAKDLGDGGAILGHPTAHWKTHQTMTTAMQVQGDTVAMSADMFIDTWFAKDLPRIAPEGVLTSNPAGLDSESVSLARTFLGDSVGKVIAAYKRMPKAIPLKIEMKGSMAMGEMDVLITTTREVTSFTRGKFGASMFEVPKGYKLVDNPMRKLMPNTSQSPGKQF